MTRVDPFKCQWMVDGFLESYRFNSSIANRACYGEHSGAVSVYRGASLVSSSHAATVLWNTTAARSETAACFDSRAF